MSTKLDAQKVADFHAKSNSQAITNKITEQLDAKLSTEHRDGASELEAMGASGKSYNAQAKDSPLLMRATGFWNYKFSGYAEKLDGGYKSLSKQDEINKNHSIQSNITQLSKIFSNPEFYQAIAKLRNIHDEINGEEICKPPFEHEANLERDLRTVYNQFISEDNSHYYGDLAVRMLDGHFGMFNITADNYTSSAVHSAVISCIDPLGKELLFDNINTSTGDLRGPIPLITDGLERAVTGAFAERMLNENDNDESLDYGKHLPVTGQGPNNLHFDMLTMLALQAERWGINGNTAKDSTFRDNLKNTMVQWAETVYASRALKMLEAQDAGALSSTSESKFVLSADDANWLQKYINKNTSSQLDIENKTANALNDDHIEAIKNAQNVGKDNTDSVLNKGYTPNLNENGESIEHEASIEWKKQAVKALNYVKPALENWKDGRTSVDQASDALLARSVKHDGLTI